MPGGMLYRSFLKPFLTDFFHYPCNLTLASLPALLKSERGTQVSGVPTPHCLLVCQRGDLWAELLSPVLTIGLNWEPGLTPRLPIKLVGAGLPLA